jgi:hypothetical protein
MKSYRLLYYLFYLANDEVSEVLVHSIVRLGRNTIDIMNTIQDFT